MKIRNLAGLVTAAAGLALPIAAQAQFVIVDNVPGTFVDITATGTAITGVGDDTLHTFESSVGNTVFPAGFVTVCSNGFMCAGNATAAPFTNAAIPTTGMPAGPSVGTMGYLMPFWDDLYAVEAPDT